MIVLWLSFMAIMGQTPADTGLIEVVRAGTARYRTVAAALADGYRPIGPDAPGMGRHYVHARLVLEGGLDPVRPQALSYLKVGDSLRLIAVAYVVPGDGVPGRSSRRGHSSATT